VNLPDAVSLAQSGKTVLIVARYARLRRAFEAVADGPHELVSRINRATGAERVSFETGGTIRFVAADRGGGRSATTDLVLIDEAAARSDAWLERDLGPVVAPGGRLVVAPLI
jgi:hypothetical protein